MKRDGKDTEYRSLHYWVERQLGKPSKCEICGTTENRHYQWASVDHKYKREISAWKRLCIPCHTRFDNRRPPKTKKTEQFGEYCPKEHKLVIANLYLRKDKRNNPTSRYIECKLCRQEARHKFNLQNKNQLQEVAHHG